MVKRFLTQTSALFGIQQNSILAASTVIMTTVAVSRILGLARVRLLTDRFTADELGVYFAAFRLPNLVFELIVMGALSSAFIPVFTSYLSKETKQKAFNLASSVINLALICFGILTLFILIFTDPLTYIIAPGFSGKEHEQLVLFTRIMLVAQVFPLMVGNFFTGILQSYKNFIIPALAPVLYNVGIIAGIVLLTPSIGIVAPVIGVVIGACLFLLLQIPAVYFLGYRHRMKTDIHEPGVREVGKLMLPRTFGLAFAQIDSTVDLGLASLLGARNVTIFTLAQQLQQLPIGLFGASIAQAALPTLAELRAHKNIDEFKHAFLTTFHQVLFLTLPAAVLLIVLRIPIVRLAFGASQFDWPATVTTGRTLAYFALSLSAQSLIHLLARAFFSLYDSKTPVIIGIIAVITNTILSLSFIHFLNLPVWGLAISASVASIVHMVFLLFYLDKAVGKFNRKQLFLPPAKMAFASFVMGMGLYIPMKLLDQLVFDTTRTFHLFLLTGVATSIGLGVYIFLAWFLNIEEVKMFFKLARRVMKVKQPIMETTREVVESSSENI